MRLWTFQKTTVLKVVFVAIFALHSQAHAQEESRPTKMRERAQLLEKQVDQLMLDLKGIHGSEEPGYVKMQIAEITGKLEFLGAQISAIVQTISKSTENEAEQDARLDDVAAEVASLWKEIESLKVMIAGEMANPTAGYENGFFVKSKDDKFRLTLNGFVCPYS